MQIFVDTASISEIERWLEMGVVDGVTTNPSIMLKDGIYDTKAGVEEIATLINPRPLSVEVTTNDLDEMMSQAREFASWAPNIIVKIPQTNQDGVPCYGVMNQLEQEGIKVNATVALSIGQLMLASKAGATYVSVFIGRVTDEGGNGIEVISNCVQWLERWNYKSQLIIGSIRSVGDVLTSAIAGAHIITIPPQFLAKMADHKFTRETVRQFTDDAQKALEMMEKERI